MNATLRAPVRGLATCAACRANIVWVESTRGRAMPINAHPTDDGNLILSRTGEGKVVAVVAKAGDALCEPRYVSHFSTCPDPRFRRPRKRSGAMRQP